LHQGHGAKWWRRSRGKALQITKGERDKIAVDLDSTLWIGWLKVREATPCAVGACQRTADDNGVHNETLPSALCRSGSEAGRVPLKANITLVQRVECLPKLGGPLVTLAPPTEDQKTKRGWCNTCGDAPIN
jgi:hypothetical protein